MSGSKTTSSRSTNGYVRVADIASGGVGHVVLALRREGSFERLYAVKRLRAELREDEDFRTMFFDEARIAGYVRHANVVSVLDVGEDADGPYLVMDYVEGVPLWALVKHAQRTGTELPLQVVLRIGIQAARGLHAAHELVGPDGTLLQLVHRDVSPQNILVGFDGVTRVTDFGVAKAFGRTTRTVTGVLKGKFGYMAPEQFRFEAVDRRTDLFALGIVLFELLTGGRLYRSVEENDGVRRILDEPPPDLGEKREDAPPRLVELLFSMLAKFPDQRPRTALEVARVLEEVLSEVELTEPRIDVGEFVSEAFAVERELQSSRARMRPMVSEAPPAQAPQPPRARRVGAWVALVVTACLAVGAGVAWSMVRAPDASISAPNVATPPPLAARDDAPVPAPAVATESSAESPSESRSDPSTVTQTDTPTSQRTRPPRRGRSTTTTMRGGASVPQWDWQ